MDTPFPASMARDRLAGLPPVADAATRILVLGSFPGNASLAASQYYAHPRNQFWRLMSAVLDLGLTELPYGERLAMLLGRGIGLWDVIDRCHRIGSLDSAIRNPLANDFSLLSGICPDLRRVCFNGKTSGRYAPLFSAAGYETLVLPSSSPANMQSTFSEKITVWRGIIHDFA